MVWSGCCSGLSICPVEPARLATAMFTACVALFANFPDTVAATPQFDGHYIYARSVPCRSSASATCRRRPKSHSPTSSQGPANDVSVVEFGPGSVRLQGNVESLRLEVHDSTIATVLAAMGRAFGLQYHSATALDGAVAGTYGGSLSQVIGRLLDGYNYTIKYQGTGLEVAVLGRSHGRPVGPTPNPAVPVAAAPVRRGRCACPPISPPPFATRLSRQNRCACNP